MPTTTKVSPGPQNLTARVMFQDSCKTIPWPSLSQNLYSFFDKDFSKLYEKLLAKGWEVLGDGRHRFGFKHPNAKCVLKVSYNVQGVKANLTELHYSKLGDEITVIYPWTDGRAVTIPVPRVLGHVRVGLLSVLCVEWVRRVSEDDAMTLADDHPWVHEVDADDDGPQVGYTHDGRLVCFDWCTF